MTRARTAALAAIGVALLAVLAVLVSGGGGTYTASAVFANVNGLVSTGSVEVAGFKVGEITGISVRLGGYPRVTMRITDGYRLRAGARAVIELGSLAGQLNRYIAISGGTGPPLPDGATIPLARTDQPVEIDQFLSALDPRTRGELRSLLHDAVHALQGRGGDIERALRHSAGAFEQTANLLADVGADGAALRTLVARAAQGAHALAAEPADVRATIDRLAQLLGVAAGRQTQITASLQRLPGAFSSTRLALARFDRSLPLYSRLVDVASPTLTSIDPFARALRVTAPLSLPVFASVMHLVQSFRVDSPTLTRLLAPPLPDTLRRLGQGVRGINPVFEQLRARAPDVLGWLPLLGDVTANYDLNGHGALVIAQLRPPGQRLVNPPSCAAGWVPRPYERTPGQLACDPWTAYLKSFVAGGAR